MSGCAWQLNKPLLSVSNWWVSLSSKIFSFIFYFYVSTEEIVFCQKYYFLKKTTGSYVERSSITTALPWFKSKILEIIGELSEFNDINNGAISTHLIVNLYSYKCGALLNYWSYLLKWIIGTSLISKYSKMWQCKYNPVSNWKDYSLTWTL